MVFKSHLYQGWFEKFQSNSNERIRFKVVKKPLVKIFYQS